MALVPALKEAFLSLWRAVLPRFYTQPIEDEGDGEGFDVPSSHAAIFEQLEDAANVSQQSYYLKPHSTQTGAIAASGRKASGEVLVTRAAPTVGELTLPIGTVFEAHEPTSLGDDRLLGRYLSLEEVTLPQSVTPQTVAVEAEFQGYTGNVRATVVDRFAELGRRSVQSRVNFFRERFNQVAGVQTDPFLTNLVGRYVRLVSLSPGVLTSENAAVPRRVIGTFTEPGGAVGIITDLALDDPADAGKTLLVEVEEWADLGLTVSQPDPIAGGVGDALGAIGNDRRQGKVPGESDEAFRRRLCDLGDTISPNAIVRIVDGILSPKGVAFEFKETGDVDSLMGFTWDVHPYDHGQIQQETKPGGSELIGQGIVWLSLSEHVRFFIICVDRAAIFDFGAAYDALVFSPGFPNAWDEMFFDGADVGFDSLIGQVWEAVNQARAAGVGFVILLRE